LKNILKYVIGFRTDTKSKKLVAIITLVLGILLFGIGCSLTTKTNNVEVSKNITASVTQKDNSTDNVVVKTDTIDTSKETITPITKVDTTTADTSTNEQLKVSYINVGQADSILVEQGSSSMLIDAGNNGDSETVKNYVENQGITTLDFLVGTHPHEDHIGGMDYIINAFKIGKIYMPKATTTTQTFNDVITAIKNKNMQITTPIVGDSFKLGQATCTILSPNNSTYEDLNNYSVVIKITFKDNTFIFEGDAGAVSEMEMVKKGLDLKAEVLKVGHHGSKTATCENFLNAVNPKYAIISVGKDNSYNHPQQSTMKRLESKNIPVYRTDENGTIVCTSDGKNITFKTETGSIGSYKYNDSASTNVTPPKTNTEAKVEITPVPVITPVVEQTPAPVVSNNNKSITVYTTNTGKKYHSDGCRYLNKSKIAISLTDAKSKGLTPCSVCNPPQ